MSRRLIVLLALLVTAGCAWRETSPMTLPVQRELASPSALAAVDFQQVLQVQAGSRQFQMLVTAELCDGVLQLALLTPAGLPMLQIRQVQQSVQVRGQPLPAGLTAEQILADLQLVYWPASALTAVWAPAWTLQQLPDGRLLSYQDEPVVRVRHAGDPWQTEVELEHLIFDYRLRVETLAYMPRTTDLSCGQ